MAKVFSNFYGLKSSSTYSSLKCHFFLLTNFKDLEDFFIIKKGVNVGPRFLIKLYKIPTQKPKKLMDYKSQIIWWKINKRIEILDATIGSTIRNRSSSEAHSKGQSKTDHWWPDFHFTVGLKSSCTIFPPEYCQRSVKFISYIKNLETREEMIKSCLLTFFINLLLYFAIFIHIVIG